MRFGPDHRAALADILRWRRDVRHFRPDPLPDGALDRLQGAMAHAPSVGNARPWRVIRVLAPTLRAAIRAEFLRCNTDAAAIYDGDRRDAYLALKLAGLDNAPEQLAVFTDTAPAAGHGLGRQTQPETLALSTAMAIHTLWLAARAENIGLGMLSILDPARVERLLDTPPHWRFAAFLCVGLPSFDDDTPLLHRKGWQENDEPEWAVR